MMIDHYCSNPNLISKLNHFSKAIQFA